MAAPVKPQETTNYELLGKAWEGLGNTRARLANTAKRAPNMLTHHRHVRVHVCTVSIQWVIQTNTYQSSETTILVTAVDETSKNDKLRVAWEGLGNTRARRTNTAECAPSTHTYCGHVPLYFCTVAMLWKFHTNPYQSGEHQVETAV